MKKIALGLLALAGMGWMGGAFDSSLPTITPQSSIVNEIPVQQIQEALPEAPKIEAAEKKFEPKQEAPKVITAPASCGSDYYRNVDGNCVHVPDGDPAGATAKCRDGTYSYSQNRRGTCSHHGGVAQWL